MTQPKAKTSPLFFALAAITIALSSWGLFRLFVDFADMPVWLAPFAVGGLDLVAVLLGSFALTVSGDGDSPGPWNAALLVFTGLAGVAQYWHALLAGQPQVIGLTMAAFPVATVLLFEGQLRRAARLNGRARGAVAAPRQTVPLLVWVHFPKLAWRATREAILAQGHLGERQGLAQLGDDLAMSTAAKPAPAAPVLLETVSSSLQVGPTKSASRPARDKPSGQSVAASVEAAAGRVGRDVDAVRAEVQRTTHPDVSRDTVRKSLSRIPTNGHVHA